MAESGVYRVIGAGSQILRTLGVTKMRLLSSPSRYNALGGFGLEVVEFIEADYPVHYIHTPYAYLPKLGRKYVAPLHVDLGQGLIQLIDEVSRIK